MAKFCAFSRTRTTAAFEGLPGVLVPLFPSIFAVCSHVSAAFPYLFPITYRLTTCSLSSIPPPHPLKNWRRLRRKGIQNVNSHVVRVTLDLTLKKLLKPSSKAITIHKPIKMCHLPWPWSCQCGILFFLNLPSHSSLPLRWWLSLRDRW